MSIKYDYQCDNSDDSEDENSQKYISQNQYANEFINPTNKKYIDKIKDFLSQIKTYGGKDIPENINKAFRRALRLKWKSNNRCIIHIADAPCHGSQYHENYIADDYPKGYNEKSKDKYITWEEIFYNIKRLGINYIFLQVNDTTNIMIEKWQQIWKNINFSNILYRNLLFDVKSIKDDAEMFALLMSNTTADSINMSVSQSFQSIHTLMFSQQINQPIEENKESNYFEPQIFQELESVVPDTLMPTNWDLENKLLWQKHISDEGQMYYINNNLTMDECLKSNRMNFQKQKNVKIYFRKTPFAKGSFKLAYYCMDQMQNKFVMKRPFKNQTKKEYFQEMKKSMLCDILAREFNKRMSENNLTNHQIYYLNTFLIQSSDKNYYQIEGYIPGQYKKISNNWNYLNPDIDTRIYTAFSHFTWHITQHQYLVTDIQGVNNILTDPIIHSKNFKFGNSGDLGRKGIMMFFWKHKCNQICEILKLSINKNQGKFINLVFKEIDECINNQLLKFKKCINKFCNNMQAISVWCTECQMKFNQYQNNLSEILCSECNKSVKYNQFEFYTLLKDYPKNHRDVNEKC